MSEFARAYFNDWGIDARTTFFESLGDLPPQLARTIVQGYQARVSRLRGEALLGEYAPALIAQLLPMRDPAGVLQCLSVPLMHVYAYVLLTDDVIDEEDADYRRLALACGLLLTRGIGRLLGSLPDPHLGAEILDRYALRSAAAVLAELEGRSGEHRDLWSMEQLAAIGDKGAPLGLLAHCMLLADGQSDPPTRHLNSIHKLTAGLQLLDDATDWAADWHSGHVSPLIAAGLHYHSRWGGDIDSPSRWNGSKQLALLILSGGLEDNLHSAARLLTDALAESATEGNSPAAQWLTSKASQARRLARLAADARQVIESHVTTEVTLDPQLAEALQRPLVRRRVAKVDESFWLVNQDS